MVYNQSKGKSTPEMFVRMLAVHCDQNYSYEIIMNGYQARKNQQSQYFTDMSFSGGVGGHPNATKDIL